MLFGNLLAMTMGMTEDRRKEFFYLLPANMGLGLTNPSVLFSFVSLFEHRGNYLYTNEKAKKTNLEQNKPLLPQRCISSVPWAPFTVSP